MSLTKKILVLGNGPSINDIEFNRLSKDIQTFGVNRIWLKHFPTYYFFHDFEILTELNNNHIAHAKLISKSICYSSDWINQSNATTPHWLRKYERTNRRKFPDSVTTGLSILNNNILSGKLSDYTFYMAGINLKWTEPSHFWKDIEYDSKNKKDRNWYDARFAKMLDNFRDLKSIGFNMISVTPNSNLNKLMRFENIANLYSN